MRQHRWVRISLKIARPAGYRAHRCESCLDLPAGLCYTSARRISGSNPA